MSSRSREARSGRRSRASSRSRVQGASFWEIVGVTLGVIVIVLGVTYVIGAYYLTGVLGEIAQKDFTPANQRLNTYEDFFIRLERQGLAVEKSPPYIREGVKYFLWTVASPESTRRLIYRWQHDLESNRVSPLTSPATHLDVELGYVRRQEVGLYPYQSGDELAMALAKGTYRVTLPEVEEAAPGSEDEAAVEEPPAGSEEDGAIEVGDAPSGDDSGEAVDIRPAEGTGDASGAEDGEQEESTPEEEEGDGDDDGDGDSPPEGEGIPID